MTNTIGGRGDVRNLHFFRLCSSVGIVPFICADDLISRRDPCLLFIACFCITINQQIIILISMIISLSPTALPSLQRYACIRNKRRGGEVCMERGKQKRPVSSPLYNNPRNNSIGILLQGGALPALTHYLHCTNSFVHYPPAPFCM